MRFLKKRPGPNGPGPAAAVSGSSSRRGRVGAPVARGREPDWRSYDSVADAYAQVHAPRMALPAKDLVELAGVGPGARVLDVGSGTGVAARAAAAAAGEAGLVVGIDPSLPMLRAAAREGGGPRYAAAEAIDLPFRNGAFDAVIASFVLALFTKYDTALFDLLRVLRPGGVMGVAVWGPSEDEFQRAWREVAWEFAEREILADAMRRATPWEERFSDPSRLKDTLHEAGVRDMVVDRREYRFQMTREEYLTGREVAASGRFLRQMLGEELWERLRTRARQVFAERFPERLNDFREVIVVVGRKP